MTHSFDVEIAKEYGILEAVIINHFVFWLSKNRANQANYHDGDYWTYNSTAAFQELFPYASKRQIERALQHLRDEDIIKVGNYNAVKYDRTLWYAFTEKGKSISRFGEMEITEKGNGNHQMVTPIPDSKPVTYTGSNTDNTLNREQAPSWMHDPELSPRMISAISNWLEYKKERREGYKPAGLKALLSQIKNQVRQYGEEPVIDIMLSSMGSGYKGICFDKLKNRSWQRPQAQSRNPFMEILREEQEKKYGQGRDGEDFVTVESFVP